MKKCNKKLHQITEFMLFKTFYITKRKHKNNYFILDLYYQNEIKQKVKT